jgi:type IV pilus assembly protein PilQ
MPLPEPAAPAPAPAPEPQREVSDAANFGVGNIQIEQPAAPAPQAPGPSFEPRAVGAERRYFGEPMDLSLQDADVKDVLRSFAQLGGVNLVLQPGVTGQVTVELVQVPWDQALEQILKITDLGYDLDGNIMRIAPIAKLRQEAEEQQRLVRAQALSIPLSTVIRRISYARASEIARVLTARGGVMSQRGSVIVDQRTNTLIMKELPAFMNTVIAIIENLDIPEPQVMIEARIIETTKRFSRSIGVRWGFQGIADAAHGNPTGLEFPNNGTVDGGVNLLTGGQNGFISLSLGNLLNTFNLDATLNAAEAEGLINILSAPRVATLNNEQASIQSGLQIPIQTVANNTVSVQFVNATLRLDVTPQVTAEGTVLMDINIQKREPQLAFAVVGASNAPISTKEARTRVIVRDGGTTVIGGIYEVSTDQGEDRVPGLASIPIIKHLFKNKRRSDENEELLIFITPRVTKL